MKAWLPLTLIVSTCAPLVHADGPAPQQGGGWSGAIGAGPMIFPRYTGGKTNQVWTIPLCSVAYDDMLYVEPLRAGAYVWGSEDRKMGLGLAFEPRMGFKGRDAPRLAGMATRRNSLEGGPAFDWDLGFVAISASLFSDLTRASHGNSARFYIYRELVANERWKAGAFAGVDHLRARVANYFFGVSESEALPGRPTFSARSTTNPNFGVDGLYRPNKDYAVLFGLQATWLGNSAAASPIVETRRSVVGWLGLGFNL